MKETKTRRETQPYGIRPVCAERTPRSPPLPAAPIAGAWRGLAGFLAVAGTPGAPKRDGEQKVQTPSPDRDSSVNTDSPVS